MCSRPFKATALNPKIIQKRGAYGVPPKHEVPVTVSAPFKFTGKYQNPSDIKEELLQLDNKEIQKVEFMSSWFSCYSFDFLFTAEERVQGKAHA